MSLGSTPLVKDSFSQLPALDAENGDDAIDADIDLGSFYTASPGLPVHGIPSPSAVTSNYATSAHRTRGTSAGSAGSFADFVSAAPPPRRSRRTRGSLLAGGATKSGSTSESVAGSSSTGPSEGEEDEASSVGTGTSRTRT
jgi:hypothetical protein